MQPRLSARLKRANLQLGRAQSAEVEGGSTMSLGYSLCCSTGFRLSYQKVGIFRMNWQDPRVSTEFGWNSWSLLILFIVHKILFIRIQTSNQQNMALTESDLSFGMLSHSILASLDIVFVSTRNIVIALTEPEPLSLRHGLPCCERPPE